MKCNGSAPLPMGSMIILLMGVSGVGKSTVGAQLAARLGWEFHDADDLHSAANVARMRGGRPLDDEARIPWLLAVRDVMLDTSRRAGNAVVACSALKASYRAVLLDGVPHVRLVHLTAPAEVLRERVAHRERHFMPPALVDSQVATLEPPAGALVVDATRPLEEVVESIVGELRL
jgi:gluconokinase